MALLQVILFLLMAPSGLALTSPPPRQQLTMGTGFNDPALMRRSFFAKSFSLAAGMGVIAAPNRADAKELGLAPVSQLYDELVDLKAQVHDGLKGTPVKRVVENTLEPMQRAMEKNPNNVQADTTRALELKGHMFELAQAMGDPNGYAEYASKTTKGIYPGGKVERELEEAVETVGDYCKAVDCLQLFVAR